MKSSEKALVDQTKDKKLALHYMETLVDVARESFLILDSNLKVIAANPIFLKTFRVNSSETIDVSLYKLGNGQWDIPELKKLLEEILPKNKAVRNYEVNHKFEKIGEKTMLVNARQIDTVQLIIIAIEDFTNQKTLEKKLISNSESLEHKVNERTAELAERIKSLEALNELMIGREMKMIELKKEIAELNKMLHQSNFKL